MYCIQTLAKNEYSRVTKEILKTGSVYAELEERLEALKTFLTETDFGKLRSEYEPYLVQGKHIEFTIISSTDGTKSQFKVF